MQLIDILQPISQIVHTRKYIDSLAIVLPLGRYWGLVQLRELSEEAIWRYDKQESWYMK